MATDIKIVIKGDDQFSPTFAALDDALAGIGSSAERAAERLAGTEEAVSGIAASTGAAAQSAVSFAQGMEEGFTAIAESQQAALEEISLQQVTSAEELGERLLEVDADFQDSRDAQRETANARERRQSMAHQEALVAVQLNSLNRQKALEAKYMRARLETLSEFFAALTELAASHGRSSTELAKTLGIAQALVDTYRAVNNALASVPYPFNLAAAAVMLTQGLANVQKIRQIGIAHGGLDFVPREQTFLLDRGERVLSASQNKDLTGFLTGEADAPTPRGFVVENLVIHILENATSGGALLELEEEEMRQLVAERIVPALDELSRLGIQPEFVERNT